MNDTTISLNPAIIPLWKPPGKSSTRIIASLKRFLPHRTRIGHSGTLDPFAEGLLLVCIGRPATRHIPHLHTYPKTYTATGQLGIATTTLDYTGPIIFQSHPMPPLSYDEFAQAIIQFPRTYNQVPPLYSAVKHTGTPLYALARQGYAPTVLADICKQKAKPVTLLQLTLDHYQFPFFTITATCSTGTYIRSLIDDIAQSCGTRATTLRLIRTAIGPYTSAQAVAVSDLLSRDALYHAAATHALY